MIAEHPEMFKQESAVTVNNNAAGAQKFMDKRGKSLISINQENSKFPIFN